MSQDHDLRFVKRKTERGNFILQRKIGTEWVDVPCEDEPAQKKKKLWEVFADLSGYGDVSVTFREEAQAAKAHIISELPSFSEIHAEYRAYLMEHDGLKAVLNLIKKAINES